MQQLQSNIGMYLCDLKEENLLITHSEELIGYVLVLTDLGGAFCRQVDPLRVYSDYYTPLYADMEIRRKHLSQADHVHTESEMVQNELFTLCRMVQRIIIYSVADKQLRMKMNRLF